MSDEGQVSKRRVYDLPVELVERITAFQQDKKLPSEVEAVRRLLDEALKYRDTPELLVERIKDRLRTSSLVHSIGNDVLREHPLVALIDQSEPDFVGFRLKDGRFFRVHADGHATQQSENNYDWWEPFPVTIKALPRKRAIELDDENPF